MKRHTECTGFYASLGMSSSTRWRQVRLSEIAEVQIGGTPSRNVPAYWDPAKVTNNKWVAISDLKSRFIAETAEHISDLGVEHSNVKAVPSGTVIMSFKLSI